MPGLATAAAASDQRRHCILLWMAGGPSQVDTWDTKPNHENGGEFAEIATRVPGMRFSEHLPRMAENAEKLAIVRSLNSKEGDHERGSYLLQTGKKMGGPMRAPAIRSLISQQLAPERSKMPPLVSIAGNRFFSATPLGPEFLGPRYQSLNVSLAQAGRPADNVITSGVPANFSVDALDRAIGIDDVRWDRRMQLWSTLQGNFIDGRRDAGLLAHRETYLNACQLMTSVEATAFDLSGEPESLRLRYGVGSFGQGCLLARRLVEVGVSCVEVTLQSSSIGGSTWDSHSQNFSAVENLSRELDAGFATLLEDLADRGLLESTTVVCMGEFGRTPRINRSAGRDHFPQAFSGVIAGGNVVGGQVYGKTSEDGMQIVENPVSIPQWLATVCEATGISPSETVTDDSGRPIPIVDSDPIGDLIG